MADTSTDTFAMPDVPEGDLEDGEIDDDEDEVCDKRNIAETVVTKATVGELIDDVDGEITAPIIPLSSTTKTKKHHIVEDDHASSIENAIASALKKKGIEPPMPKILEFRSEQETPEYGQGQSRSSRRRKRKKKRDDKDKDRKEKRNRFESPERIAANTTNIAAPVAATSSDVYDLDDYEMMNVRGGSPPAISSLPAKDQNQHFEIADDDSCSSYDSYDSQHNRFESRRNNKSSNKESRKSRRDRSHIRDDRDERNGRGSEKRARRDSEDSKHRMEPRKLELCKFYLMECCAKKDKCSYMHSDFPCKYYYLGMECVYGTICKFSHGKPLTEQLRNILLKHLETAPKEILGQFKRISRETAITQINVRNVELCKEFGVDSLLPATMQSGSRDNHPHHHHHNKQQHQPQQQQNPASSIPSLLNMVIEPPPSVATGGMQDQQKEKHRKSRWCDNNSKNSNNHAGGTNITTIGMNELPVSTAPSYLELKKFTGILNTEQIEKLSKLNIVNLDQVNQLTVGQLNQIGLSIAEISEIQMNAISMAKMGATETSVDPANQTVDKIDVDMRFLPPAETESHTKAQTVHASVPPDKDSIFCSNSNSNSSGSGVVLVDYSQYLKDSNLSYDRSDLLDDEKDDEQLVIDDEEIDAEDANFIAASVDEHDDNADIINITKRLHSTEALMLSHTVQSDITLTNPFTKCEIFKRNDDDSSCERYTRSPPSDVASTSKISFISKFNTFREISEDNSLDHQRLARSRSRSATPTRSLQSQCLDKSTQLIYERPSMYDFKSSHEDSSNEYNKESKADQDMRQNQFHDSLNSDIDLRLPFQPVTNYIPATEIDASITSHLPVAYKVYEVDVPPPVYTEQRQNSTFDKTNDPRLRRIIGLPELSKTNTAALMTRGGCTASTSIASPEDTAETSPSYYTPPSSTNTATSSIYATVKSEESDEREKTAAATKLKTSQSTPRLDPRRAAALSANTDIKPTASSSAHKQNIEIRNLLQKSEWYKNLNSKSKIMVNQQLALVSTELKKFHQDESPDKAFDMEIVVNNPYLQQILHHLGIYIDFNGEVCNVESDPQFNSGNNILPNLSQMPPNMQPQQQQQMDFLRGPPPGMIALGPMQYVFGGNVATAHPPQHMGMPSFPISAAPNARPSLLGMPPLNPSGNNPFNPFSNVGMIDLNNANYSGNGNGPGLGAGMLGTLSNFGNFNVGGLGAQPKNMQQRNFGSQRNNRNQRRNKKS